MAITPTLNNNVETINSILNEGILPASQLREKGVLALTSYDQDDNDFVSFNCVTQIKGISEVLFNRACGAFPIFLERRNDSAFKDFSTKNNQNIQQEALRLKKEYQIPETNTSFDTDLRAIAASKLINEDPAFLNTLKERTHRSALLILQLNEKPIVSDGGFAEMRRRGAIKKEEIQYLILSKNEFENLKDQIVFSPENIILVDTIQTDKIIFSPYPQTQIKISSLEVPDYESGIKEFINKEKLSEQTPLKPFFTHGIRLKTDSEIT